MYTSSLQIHVERGAIVRCDTQEELFPLNRLRQSALHPALRVCFVKGCGAHREPLLLTELGDGSSHPLERPLGHLRGQDRTCALGARSLFKPLAIESRAGIARSVLHHDAYA